MTSQRITLLLTILAVIVVVLTRVRLSKNHREVAGRLSIPKSLLDVHTGAGALALVSWTAFLVSGAGPLGMLGLLLWWVTVFAGLLILSRWLPPRGRHSSGPMVDAWGEGPWLSALAHLGLGVGVSIFTSLLVLGEL